MRQGPPTGWSTPSARTGEGQYWPRSSSSAPLLKVNHAWRMVVAGGESLAGETGDCNLCWDRARKVPRFAETCVPSVEEMRTPSAGDPSYQILDGDSFITVT